MEITRKEVSELLKTLGIPASTLGYKYITEAVMLISEGREEYRRITKTLYPKIAKACNVTVTSVERAISHAVEVSFSRMEQEVIEDIFGSAYSYEKGKPTNKEFLWACVLYLENQ